MTPAPLTESDYERLFRRVVPEWMIDRFDTSLGTVEAVKSLKQQVGTSLGGVGQSPDDGPYSSGENEEYWSFSYNVTSKGAEAKVERNVRSTDEREVIRAGRMTWTQLANRTTCTALRKRSNERTDQQLQLSI